ncbi:MAG: sigma-54 dependent transcriptional regulator [Planctomycetota bacterium]
MSSSSNRANPDTSSGDQPTDDQPRHVRILVVEDRPTERKALVKILQAEGHDVSGCENTDKALGYLDENIDIVMTDLYLGDEKNTGIRLMELWRKKRTATQFILFTGQSRIDTAVEAMRKGAFDYITKPLNTDELMISLNRAIKAIDQDREIDTLRRRLDQRFGLEQIVGQSKQMREVFDRIQRAAPTDSTVLVLGESGTGKELVAQALHQNSPRKTKPFVAINIAAVPGTLVESELFGHVRGAFTGAMEEREGRFEQADGGTLFIDEVGDFEIGLQAKLLRVLETLTVTPVGGSKDRKVNVRVIAATSRDLRKMVADGDFREDLFYRLNVIPITLPPLRDRPDDIPLLIEHFLSEISARKNVESKKVGPEVMHAMQRAAWPGNVRELRNVLETMMVLAEGDTLQPADLPEQFRGEADRTTDFTIPRGMTMDDLERLAIESALSASDGNRTHAAEQLGISVRTLQRKLRQYDFAERNG